MNRSKVSSGSKVYDVAVTSPLTLAAKLSTQVGCDTYFKREDLQPVHSFKLRGAYNKIVQLTEAEKQKGVIAASAGNHAQGVALAAQKLGLNALIIMPVTTPAIKVEAVRGYGASIELFGDNYSEAFEYCKKRITETGMIFVHPFDDLQVIEGQGTIGTEILEQLPDVTHVFVPIGGGGLVAGVAEAIKKVAPHVQIIGVEPADSNAMQLSIKESKRVVLTHVGIFADGVAVKQVGEHTFALTKKYVDKIMTVTTDQMCAAIKAIYEDTRAIVEPAGALAAAAIMNTALPKTARVVAICSGANMSFEKLQQIAERTLIGSGKEAIYSVTLPEQPGALKSLLADVINGYSITEFNYRLHDRSAAHIFLGVHVGSPTHKAEFEQALIKHAYEFTDLSSDDIAKEHIRHMIGGVSTDAESERVYEVTFPERPGALADFLESLGDAQNISLFHYRSMASDSSSVLIGFESHKHTNILQIIKAAGFEAIEVTHASALKLFVTSA